MTEGDEWNEGHPFFDLTEHEFLGTDEDAPRDDWERCLYPDYGYWSKAPYWTADEGVALSYGRNPRVVNWSFLSGYKEHPFAKHYNKRLDLLIRAQKLGQLRSFIEPSKFIRWATNVGIEFPSELETAVGQIRREGVRDWQADYAALAQERDMLAAKIETFERTAHLDKPLLDSERQSMLAIIATMASGGYTFVSGGNSKVPQEIVDDAVKVGLHIDVKTVRKYLQSSAKLIPPEDTEKP